MKPRGGAWFVTVAVMAGVGFAGFGIWSRQKAVATLRVTAQTEAIDPVQVMAPQHGPATRSLTLPGSLRAWYEAPIYAQVSGYVKDWYKDYGASVKAGDLLASIDAPELDEQYGTAEANLGVEKAKSAIAAVTARRWKALAGTEAVSQQDVDVRVADAKAEEAQVQAAEHEVARYKALEAFKSVVAPFDGVVTSRRTDRGAYVNSGGGDAGSHGASTELFSVADIGRLRVFVSVPQDYAAFLRPGLTATLSLPQFPGRTFPARFLATAHAFDPQSRSVVTEFIVDNPDHALWPGSYVEVHFTVPTDQNILVVPEQALMFRAEGMQVALVTPANTVHLQRVELGVTLDGSVQVLSHLKGTDQIIVNPSAGLLEGQEVRVVRGVEGYAVSDSSHEAPAPAATQLAMDKAAGTGR